MLRPLAVALLLVAGLQGCVVYEYEHEFWLDTDGSGSVYVTGRPELWEAFKALDGIGAATADEQKTRARRLFEQAGLEVNRVTVTHRGGRAYLFISADFEDVNALGDTKAFPDLTISKRPEGAQAVLHGTWRRATLAEATVPDEQGLMAVRFHLPSKVYEHRNASDGVERGNIVAWRQPLAAALRGSPLEFGARMDERSILVSTVALFASAVLLALALLGTAFYWVIRKGRRQLLTREEPPPAPGL